MRIIVNTLDGKTYESIDVDIEEVLDQFQATGDIDRLGWGKHQNPETEDEFKAFVNDALAYNKDLKTQVFTLTTPSGDVSMNVCHIVSWRFA